jgi:hypothetical protein
VAALDRAPATPTPVAQLPSVPASRLWRLWSWGLPTGSCGRVGFIDCQADVVANVPYAHVGHTRLPVPLHMENVWLPFLLRGVVPRGDARGQ